MKKLLGLLGLVILFYVVYSYKKYTEFSVEYSKQIDSLVYSSPSYKVKVELDIKESLEEGGKHNIDSIITISGGLLSLFSKGVEIRNRENMYGKYKSLSIQKNNIKKAIKLLENEKGLFKIERDISEEDFGDSFSLHCGIPHGNFNDFYAYYDAFTEKSIEAENKTDLIKKLKFILENVYVNDLKYNTWEVTETKNNITRKYFR